MSIIADALNRLQSREQERTSERDSSSLSANPSKPKKELLNGQRTRSGNGRIWLMGIGMFVGFGILGFAAFWVGFHLDFGLTTYASPNTTPEISLPLPKNPVISPDSNPAAQPNSFEPFDNTSTNPINPTENPNTLEKPVRPSPTTPVTTSLPQSPAPSPNKTEAGKTVEDSVASIGSNKAPLEVTKEPSHTITQPEEERVPNEVGNQLRELSPSDLSPKLSVSSEIKSNDLSPEAPAEGDSHPPKTELHLLAATLEEEMIESEGPVALVTPQTTHRSIPFRRNSLPGKGRPSVNPLPNTSPLSSTPGNRLHRAQRLIQSGKYQEAVAVLSPLFHEPPSNWEPWFWMGTAFLGQDKVGQADQYFLSGLARNDHIPQLWIQRALVAQQQGDFQLAIHQLRQAEALDATIPHTHLNMGYAYEQLGNLRLANQYYGKFLKLSEGNQAFFSTRKKLYAHLTEQMTSVPPGSPSSSIPRP